MTDASNGAKPAPHPAEIESWLLAKSGWVKASEIAGQFQLKPRNLRCLGEVPGLVSEFAISHTRKGYRHYLKATTAEWLAFKHSQQRHSLGQFRRVTRMQGRRQNNKSPVPFFNLVLPAPLK